VTLFTAAVNKREKQPTQKGTVWERASRQGPPPPHSRGSKTVIKETRLSFPFFTGIGTACMPVWSHGSSTVHTSVRYYGHWSFFKEEALLYRNGTDPYSDKAWQSSLRATVSIVHRVHGRSTRWSVLVHQSTRGGQPHWGSPVIPLLI
jgi:hypothetical protein